MRELSVCITVKNRSRATCSRKPLTLLPNCLRSLNRSLSKLGIDAEVIITDFHSDDWPLREWVPGVFEENLCGGKWGGAGVVEHTIIDIDGDFNRGKGRNAAARAATGRVLFFLDADMIVSPDTIAVGLMAAPGSAVFPLVWEYRDQEHTDFAQLPCGTGNCFVSRESYAKTWGWHEFGKWGFEDWGFMVTVSNYDTIFRPNIPTFIHQWHPDTMRDQYDRGKWSDANGTQNGIRTV